MLTRLCVGLLCLALVGCERKQDVEYVKIGTGAQTGVYYAAGLALAEMVNEGTSSHGVDLAVESTDGSVFNLNAILAGELEFAFAQADRQYEVVNGEGPWLREQHPELRAICSLYSELVTLVVAEDSGIRSLKDLEGHVVSIGSSGSGTRGNAEDVVALVGLIPDVHFEAEELKASEAAMLLQDGRIDGFFYTVGHPNGAITEVTSGRRKVRFVPIVQAAALIASKPYYSEGTLSARHYPQINGPVDVPTIGMKTTLVTHERVDEDVVYAVTKALFENLDRFRQRHPSFTDLNPTSMLEGNFAPIHPGARRYYRERRWL